MKNFKYILLVLFFTVPVLIHALLNTAGLHEAGVILAGVVGVGTVLGILGWAFVSVMFSDAPYHGGGYTKEDVDKARNEGFHSGRNANY